MLTCMCCEPVTGLFSLTAAHARHRLSLILCTSSSIHPSTVQPSGYSLRAGLEAPNPAGFPAFSMGEKPAWKLGPGKVIASFGSTVDWDLWPDPLDSPGENAPHLPRPSNAPRPPTPISLAPLVRPAQSRISISDMDGCASSPRHRLAP